MPLDGNRIGPRERYLYQTEQTGLCYVLKTDTDLAVAGFGSTTSAPDLYNPADPVPDGMRITPAPRNFKPRKVHLLNGATGARKSVTAFDPTSQLYASERSRTVTIDGLEFATTGRTGESLTF